MGVWKIHNELNAIQSYNVALLDRRGDESGSALYKTYCKDKQYFISVFEQSTCWESFLPAHIFHFQTDMVIQKYIELCYCMGNAFLSIMINHRLEKNETSQFRKVRDVVVRQINVFSIFPDDISFFVARKCNQSILAIEKLRFVLIIFCFNGYLNPFNFGKFYDTKLFQTFELILAMQCSNMVVFLKYLRRSFHVKKMALIHKVSNIKQKRRYWRHLVMVNRNTCMDIEITCMLLVNFSLTM